MRHLFNAVMDVYELRYAADTFNNRLNRLSKEMNKSVTGTRLAIDMFAPNGEYEEIPNSWDKFIDRLDFCAGNMGGYIKGNAVTQRADIQTCVEISERARALTEAWDDSVFIGRNLIRGCYKTFKVRETLRETVLASVVHFVDKDGMRYALLRSREFGFATRVALKPVAPGANMG